MNTLVWNSSNGRYEAQVVVDGKPMTLIVDVDVFAEAIENARIEEDAAMFREDAEAEMLNPLTWYGAGLLKGAELI